MYGYSGYDNLGRSKKGGDSSPEGCFVASFLLLIILIGAKDFKPDGLFLVLLLYTIFFGSYLIITYGLAIYQWFKRRPSNSETSHSEKKHFDLPRHSTVWTPEEPYFEREWKGLPLWLVHFLLISGILFMIILLMIIWRVQKQT